MDSNRGNLNVSDGWCGGVGRDRGQGRGREAWEGRQGKGAVRLENFFIFRSRTRAPANYFW